MNDTIYDNDNDNDNKWYAKPVVFNHLEAMALLILKTN